MTNNNTPNMHDEAETPVCFLCSAKMTPAKFYREFLGTKVWFCSKHFAVVMAQIKDSLSTPPAPAAPLGATLDLAAQSIAANNERIANGEPSFRVPQPIPSGSPAAPQEPDYKIPAEAYAKAGVSPDDLYDLPKNTFPCQEWNDRLLEKLNQPTPPAAPQEAIHLEHFVANHVCSACGYHSPVDPNNPVQDVNAPAAPTEKIKYCGCGEIPEHEISAHYGVNSQPTPAAPTDLICSGCGRMIETYQYVSVEGSWVPWERTKTYHDKCMPPFKKSQPTPPAATEPTDEKFPIAVINWQRTNRGLNLKIEVATDKQGQSEAYEQAITALLKNRLLKSSPRPAPLTEEIRSGAWRDTTDGRKYRIQVMGVARAMTDEEKKLYEEAENMFPEEL